MPKKKKQETESKENSTKKQKSKQKETEPEKKESKKSNSEVSSSEQEEASEKEKISLEDLPGVGPATIEKLKEAGYMDLMNIAAAPSMQLAEAAGMTETGANKVIAAARSALKLDFMTGKELFSKRESIKRLSTGSKEFDKLIGGGIETQGLFECFGEYGSGKSQIAMQIAVMAQLPKEKGGLDGHVIYIDTENTFRPERIKQISEAHELEYDEVLKKIMVARAYTSDHQMLLAEKIDSIIRDKKIPVKLIIVDSLTSLFRTEYAGRGTLATRQQKLNRHLHVLQRVADVHNVAVYVTNQVMARPDIFFGNPTAAIGGHVLGHACQFRVYLRKSKGSKRIARLIDSPYLPEGEAIFKVTEKGLEDA